ncbi:hypothetical protein Kpol_1019p18 [Vanderwaltozyma polyspora DSM 70294]|uniref:FAD-binding FR-type domain-containing protein n=1 Tax=Vanderwaltozyma polyspora (strain ATCC 22028 / DSM 70294 / BCRC 21397 / CBS 2163 / NBRC 10782 / NRRL Y-8283 / UCD 57-17) TaxID=436907 RepID=A7TPB1_VANPO|nr:uncharacterized protein Kpol_1019p18 [Vanderwaltozyma polyspora DSM 70294]EDO15898.1 hypothetical protein Kpol_1019p18 [Vanderwaltozyma polyspora DSM 70294]
MKYKYLIFSLLSFVSITNALHKVDSTLATACLQYELQFNWGCGKSRGANYTCLCSNVNWLGTITNCITEGSNDKKGIEHAFKHVAARCNSAFFDYTVDDMYNFHENGTNYLRDPTASDYTTPVIGTLRNNQTTYDWYFSKYKDYTLSVRTHQWFGWGLVFFWVTVVSVATFYNLLRKLFGVELLNNSLRKHLVVPSLYKDYKDRSYKLLHFFPLNFTTRLNSLVVAVFLIQAIVTACVGYHLPLPNPAYMTAWQRNTSMIQFRTGIMSLSLFPVIYLFGIRNNPLIEISGISFSTFNYYHKWCAYVCASYAFIHAIIWTVVSIKSGWYKSAFSSDYWNYGVAAMVFLGILVVHSKRIFRDRFYESFLILHKLLNVGFIVGMYYHCLSFGWIGWTWSMAGIWIYDRLMRAIKIFLNGGIHDAMITDCGNGVIKAVLKHPKLAKYPTGSFAYLYFINANRFWYYTFQSHPFTVMKDPKQDPNNPDSLIFYFKANRGITKKVLSRILKSGYASVSFKMLIEGPYGSPLPECKMSRRRNVGVAGGLGVTAVYPHMAELYQKGHNSDLCHKFIWIINDTICVEWFKEELDWLCDKGCEVVIYNTRSQSTADLESSSSIDKETEGSTDKKGSERESVFEIKRRYEIVNLGYRPDLKNIILKEIETTQNISEDLEFYSCGSSAFNDHFRHGVAQSLSHQWTIDISLEEKSFTW